MDRHKKILFGSQNPSEVVKSLLKDGWASQNFGPIPDKKF